MIIVLHVYVFQRYIQCPWCSTNHLWSSFYTFVYSRHKYGFCNVRYFIYDYRSSSSCIRDINSLSLLFDTSSTFITLHVCFFQEETGVRCPVTPGQESSDRCPVTPEQVSRCPLYSTFQLCSSLLKFVTSTVPFRTLLFNISSMIIVLHDCVFQT